MKLSLRILLTLTFAGLSTWVSAQPEVFNRDDFQLRGPVKSCTVLTDYGEERFEFDREGKLLKSLTRYSDTDYEITHYRYRDTVLTERRDEVYRDGAFDKSTSFAHFYQIDTLKARGDLIEKIISYDQKITEQITYKYDTIGRIGRIIRVQEEGIDETEILFTSYDAETTSEYLVNGQLSKSVRTSQKEVASGIQKIELRKEYFQGIPQKAVEEIRDASDRIVEVSNYKFDPEKEAFQIVDQYKYAYNEAGLMSRETISYYRMESGKPKVSRVSEKEFIYQTDGRTPENWIKKIVTPQNSYTTRKIAYYQPLVEQQPDSLPKQ
jgi:hypothetical protein